MLPVFRPARDGMRARIVPIGAVWSFLVARRRAPVAGVRPMMAQPRMRHAGGAKSKIAPDSRAFAFRLLGPR
jgi:hypothetical protein